MPSRRKKVGPFSSDQALTSLDGRTKPARILKSVVKELLDHLGNASAPQRLIVQAAAVKAVRLSLLTDKLLAGDTPNESSDHNTLAWLNSMRLDLQALGLERRPIKTLSLDDYLKEQAPAAPQPEAVPV